MPKSRLSTSPKRKLNQSENKVLAVIKELKRLINPYLSSIHQQTLSKNKTLTELLDQLIQQYGFYKRGCHDSIHRTYRLIAEILKDHGSHFDANKLSNFLNEIEQHSASVPQEVNDDHIHLPDEAFLPPLMKASGKQSTLTTWKKLSWSDPSRGHENEKVFFFAGPKIVRDGEETTSAAVRQHLIHHAKKDEETGNVLSYYGAEFMPAGLLEADHLQPNADILARQKEMIEAMNISRSYRERILRANSGKGFFIEIEAEGFIEGIRIIGTKYFFMLFHNCIHNLWLMRADSKKGDQCPIKWLENNKDFFGEAFFDEHGPINKKTLLYTTKGGELLAQAARRYFDREHAGTIMSNKQIQALSHQFYQRVNKNDFCSKERTLRLNYDTCLAELIARNEQKLTHLNSDNKNFSPSSDELSLSSLDSLSSSDGNDSDSSGDRDSKILDLMMDDIKRKDLTESLSNNSKVKKTLQSTTDVLSSEIRKKVKGNPKRPASEMQFFAKEIYNQSRNSAQEIKPMLIAEKNPLRIEALKEMHQSITRTGKRARKFIEEVKQDTSTGVSLSTK